MILVYPNPSNNYINVLPQRLLKGEILDIVGSTKIQKLSESSATIYVSDLKNNVYLCLLYKWNCKFKKIL